MGRRKEASYYNLIFCRCCVCWWWPGQRRAQHFMTHEWWLGCLFISSAPVAAVQAGSQSKWRHPRRTPGPAPATASTMTFTELTWPTFCRLVSERRAISSAAAAPVIASILGFLLSPSVIVVQWESECQDQGCKWLIGEVFQLLRRPLLGPSPGRKLQLPLLHLRIYSIKTLCMLNRHWPHGR